MEQEMQRKTGYYWVSGGGSHWEVGYYYAKIGTWNLAGVSEVFMDRDFLKINETKLQPPN